MTLLPSEHVAEIVAVNSFTIPNIEIQNQNKHKNYTKKKKLKFKELTKKKRI